MSGPDLRAAISDLGAGRMDLIAFDTLVARVGEHVRPGSEPGLFSDWAAIELALAEHSSGHLDLAELQARLERIHDRARVIGPV